MLDSHLSFETPEGIEIKLAIAGPVVRAMAWLIDLGIRVVIYIIAGIILSQLGKVGDGLILIALFAFEWLYPTFFEAIKGATPGKSAMGLYVIMEDGTSLTWGASFARNLLRTIDFLPFFYCLGFFFTLTNAGYQRIGDLLAGTLVVYDHKDPAITPDTDSNNTSSQSLPLALTAEEHRMIMHFSDSLDSISPQRQAEIANILTPILHEQDQAAVESLKQHAKWVKGDQRETI